MEPVQALETALEQTRQVVARIPPEQYDLPTPCCDWDVRSVMNHLLGVLAMFETIPTGEADMAALSSDHVGDDASKAYDALADSTLGAWSTEGVVDNPVSFPGSELPGDFATVMLAGDVFIHGWDLARATGQQVDWNEELAADVLAWHEEAVRRFPPELREQGFDPPVPVPDGADVMTRLIAFVGRQP
jgi:uncharacterized protein (TIGR03086 family)